MSLCVCCCVCHPLLYTLSKSLCVSIQLISRDPEFRLGCGGSNHSQAVIEIKEHAFFSAAPMDPDEEVN